MLGTCLVVQWLRLHPPNAGGLGSIPGWGNWIPHTTAETWHSQINTVSKNERKETWSHLHVHGILHVISEGPSPLTEDDCQALIWSSSLVFRTRTLKPKEVVACLRSHSPWYPIPEPPLRVVEGINEARRSVDCSKWALLHTLVLLLTIGLTLSKLFLFLCLKCPHV